MDRLAEAFEQSDAYKAAYGEDADWVELHFLGGRGPLAARRAAGRGVGGRQIVSATSPR